MFDVLAVWTDNIAAGFLLFWLFAILFAALAGVWRMYTKAGWPGWASLVPIYNMYVMVKMANWSGWWTILMLVPFVNIVFFLIVSIGVARAFGKRFWYGIGMLVLPLLFVPPLGLGAAVYRGPRRRNWPTDGQARTLGAMSTSRTSTTTDH